VENLPEGVVRPYPLPLIRNLIPVYIDIKVIREWTQ
jgi:hypothetical protein